MSRVRRVRHHTYDYNFKMGESGYRDMIDYLDRRDSQRHGGPTSTSSLTPRTLRELPSSYAQTDADHLPIFDSENLPTPRYASDEFHHKLDTDSSEKLSEKRTRFTDCEKHQTIKTARSSRQQSKVEQNPDLDVDQLIESIRSRRLRLQQEGAGDSSSDSPARRRVDSGEELSDFSRRTRQAIRDIDDDFKELGLYDRIGSVGTKEKNSFSSAFKSTVSFEDNSTLNKS